jgi:hypothetical protein
MEAALEAAATELTAVRSERDSLATRFRPVLDVEAEQQRFASDLDVRRRSRPNYTVPSPPDA